MMGRSVDANPVGAAVDLLRCRGDAGDDRSYGNDGNESGRDAPRFCDGGDGLWVG